MQSGARGTGYTHSGPGRVPLPEWLRPCRPTLCRYEQLIYHSLGLQINSTIGIEDYQYHNTNKHINDQTLTKRHGTSTIFRAVYWSTPWVEAREWPRGSVRRVFSATKWNRAFSWWCDGSWISENGHLRDGVMGHGSSSVCFWGSCSSAHCTVLSMTATVIEGSSSFVELLSSHDGALLLDAAAAAAAATACALQSAAITNRPSAVTPPVNE